MHETHRVDAVVQGAQVFILGPAIRIVSFADWRVQVDDSAGVERGGLAQEAGLRHVHFVFLSVCVLIGVEYLVD